MGSVKRVSPKPYSPRLSCEQVEANLAWVAESATVGPALWAEARATVVCLARSRRSRYHATALGTDIEQEG